jgi:TPR repeat protein
MAEPSHRLADDQLEQIREAAERGDAEAQFRLGMLHGDGEITGKPDYSEAAAWLTKAAEQGLVSAQSALAYLYSTGYGVAQDDLEAARWHRKAAENGSARDQYIIGTMYRFGTHGYEKDPERMWEWYRRAAEQGFDAAQMALGRLLAKDKSNPDNLIAAYHWFSLAILNGNAPAKRALAELSKSMSKEQIDQAQYLLLKGMHSAGEQTPAD